MPESPFIVTQRGRIDVRYDEPCDIVRIEGVGSWTLEAFERHFRALSRIYRRVRARQDRVRVIADLRRATAHASRVAVRMAECCDSLYQSGDRLAIVVCSTMAKSDMSAFRCQATTELFVSIEMATRWLNAPDVMRGLPELSIEWGSAAAV